MRTCLVVVVSCHFIRPGVVCGTTEKRILRALKVVRKLQGERVYLLTTGDVCWDPDGKTEEDHRKLSQAMRKMLIERHGVSGDYVSEIGNSVGTPSEAAWTAGMVEQLKATDVYVVSSDWYHLPGRLHWRYSFRTSTASLHFVSVHGTGGWSTWRRYFKFMALAQKHRFAGTFPHLVDEINRQQKHRHGGFQTNGCA